VTAAAGAWSRRLSLAEALGFDSRSQHGAGQEHGNGNSFIRSLGLADLVAVGLCSTVGSGIFSIAGLVAHRSAGPAATLAFLGGGLGCLANAAAYMELAGRIPVTGSIFMYAYVALGRGPAVCAAWLLTLEYGVSSAAVAANWGSKLAVLLGARSLQPANTVGISVLGGAVMLFCTCILLCGVSLGKQLTRMSSTFSICLVVSLCCLSVVHFNVVNWQPFVPPEFGVQGVLQGTLPTFFGFLGFDEVCCLGGEAKNPGRNVPLAVLLSLIGVTVLSMLAAGALTGCQHYTAIDINSGFEVAFQRLGLPVASGFVSISELWVLFIVVYSCLLAQPRIFFSMAQDGLLPSVFLRRNKLGELTLSVGITGFVMAVVAACVDFDVLADTISAGTLLVFSLANASVVMLRYEDSRPAASRKLGLFMASSLAAALCVQAWQHCTARWQGLGLVCLGATVLFALVALASMLNLGSLRAVDPRASQPDLFFAVPLVPLFPCLTIAFNFFMVSTLSAKGLAILLGYLAGTCLLTAVWAWYTSRRAPCPDLQVSLTNGHE